MSQTPHPARSPEFLSRLHDGDLAPAERVHFESHRAHCAECRRAAAEFEDALTLFRSSHPNPASPDLAVRILRKLRTTSPRRSGSFGPSFGIDLRWAGAFAAAVVAAVVGSSIVARHEERPRPSTEAAPVPVVLESGRPKAGPDAGPGPVAGRSDAKPSSPASASRPATEEVGALSKRERASDDEKKKNAPTAPEPAFSAMRQKADKLDALRDRAPVAASVEQDAGKPAAPADAQKTAALAERRMEAPPARPAESLGGEGAAGSVADSAAPALRLVVESMDAVRTVPDLARRQTLALPPALKGRSFLLVVDAGGRVRQALPGPPSSSSAAQSAAPGQGADDLSALLAIRFEPGDRQRRLLVRVE